MNKILKICKIKRSSFSENLVLSNQEALSNFLQAFGARRKWNMKNAKLQLMNAYERRSSRTDNRATVSIVVHWLFFFLTPTLQITCCQARRTCWRRRTLWFIIPRVHFIQSRKIIIFSCHHRFFYSQVFFK